MHGDALLGRGQLNLNRIVGLNLPLEAVLTVSRGEPHPLTFDVGHKRCAFYAFSEAEQSGKAAK